MKKIILFVCFVLILLSCDKVDFVYEKRGKEIKCDWKYTSTSFSDYCYERSMLVTVTPLSLDIYNKKKYFIVADGNEYEVSISDNILSFETEPLKVYSYSINK